MSDKNIEIIIKKNIDCTTFNGVELCLMRCGVMFLLLIIYIYIIIVHG